MPWQAHLFIGEVVHDYVEIKEVLDKLGIDYSHIMDNDDLFSGEAYKKVILHIPGELGTTGKNFTVAIQPMKESEGGTCFPVNKSNPYTDAIVGFELTSRYDPSILDRDYKHGRPEPFVINLNEANVLLQQVRKFWPEAQLIMWDNFH